MHLFTPAAYLVTLSTILSAAPSPFSPLPINSTLPYFRFLSSLTKETECRNPRNRYWYLSTPDCLQAINELPATHGHGTFHVSGRNDDFKLPRDVICGNCHLEVDLLRGYTEETSGWDVVRQAATELVWACVKPKMHSVNRGGYTTAGPRDAVFIKLKKPERNTGLSTAS